MPYPKRENRELVKDKTLRCKMTVGQFAKLTKIAVNRKVTRSEVVRILIEKTYQDMGL